MENFKADLALDDPPTIVGRILIKKGGSDDDGFSQLGTSSPVEFTLSFPNPPITTPPVPVTFKNWSRTSSGRSNNYPATQADSTIPMAISPGQLPSEIKFSGNIVINYGSGSGFGESYTVDIQVAGFTIPNIGVDFIV